MLTALGAGKKILKLRSLLRSMILYKVENGKHTYVWHDNWHPKGPLLLSYGHRVVYYSGLPLFARQSAVIEGANWHWPPVRSDNLHESNYSSVILYFQMILVILPNGCLQNLRVSM